MVLNTINAAISSGTINDPHPDTDATPTELTSKRCPPRPANRFKSNVCARSASAPRVVAPEGAVKPSVVPSNRIPLMPAALLPTASARQTAKPASPMRANGQMAATSPPARDPLPLPKAVAPLDPTGSAVRHSDRAGPARHLRATQPPETPPQKPAPAPAPIPRRLSPKNPPIPPATDRRPLPRAAATARPPPPARPNPPLAH